MKHKEPKEKFLIQFVRYLDETGNIILKARVNNWSILLKDGEAGYLAQMITEDDGKILTVKNKTLETRSRRLKIALDKLLKMKCVKNNGQFVSLYDLYEITFKFHLDVLIRKSKPAPKIERTSKSRYNKNGVPTKAWFSETCRHGLAIDDCPRCASWGSDYSGLREFD